MKRNAPQSVIMPAIEPAIATAIRGALPVLLAVAALASTGPTAAQGTSLRCGWFDNPSPGNAWLHDRDGDWTVSEQGVHRAQGPWPRFRRSQWVAAGGGSYGYGCACFRAQADDFSMEITRIYSAYARPLSVCRRDATLTEPGTLID